MPLTLRPIDVVFRHPVKKFTVLYQNGKLWQLPQLDFDGGSLVYKRPYTGSREQIFVAQNQNLNPADTLLLSKLATIDLPATVVGANVDEFEAWWAKKSYDYRAAVAASQAVQQQAMTVLVGKAPAPLTPNPTILQASIPAVTDTNDTPPAMPALAVPHQGNDEGDLFDSMMADLTRELR